MRQFFCKWDSENNTIIGLPQTHPGDQTFVPFIEQETVNGPEERALYTYENGVVTQTRQTISYDYSEDKRLHRYALLALTTGQGWGDADDRSLQTTEKVQEWDTYRQALRDLPTTVSTFASAPLTDDDLPTKPT